MSKNDKHGKPVRLTHISASVGGVYALDSKGRVWCYNGSFGNWIYIGQPTDDQVNSPVKEKS